MSKYTTAELVEFLEVQIAQHMQALGAREQMESEFSSGTDEDWCRAGCTMTRAERLSAASKHGHIAAKVRDHVDMLQIILARIKNP